MKDMCRCGSPAEAPGARCYKCAKREGRRERKRRDRSRHEAALCIEDQRWQ